MTMLSLIAALALAPLTPPAPQAGLADADRADALCLVALGVMVDRVEASAKPAMQAGILYFVGKLKGRNPAADVAQLMQMAGVGLDTSNAALGQIGVRCGGEIQAAGAEMTANSVR